MLSNVAAKTEKICYFEGHANGCHDYPPERYVADILKFTDFSNVELLGTTEDQRPLFRCWRGALTGQHAVDKLVSILPLYRRIVVVGKSATGKTMIADELRKHCRVYDDVLPPYEEPFVLFDFRGLEYVTDADCVFFVHCSEDERLRRIEATPYKDRLLRTPPGIITAARAFYTVLT